MDSSSPESRSDVRTVLYRCEVAIAESFQARVGEKVMSLTPPDCKCGTKNDCTYSSSPFTKVGLFNPFDDDLFIHSKYV